MRVAVGGLRPSQFAATGRPSASQSSTVPNVASGARILAASPTAMITTSSSGMYFCATRCTSAAVTAEIFSG